MITSGSNDLRTLKNRFPTLSQNNFWKDLKAFFNLSVLIKKCVYQEIYNKASQNSFKTHMLV